MTSQKQRNPKDIPKVSKDRAKLNNFYDFRITPQKFKTIQVKANTSLRRNFLTALAFGFFTQYLLGITSIYQNIVRKTTMRRLKAKLKQEEAIQNKIKRKLERQNQAQDKVI